MAEMANVLTGTELTEKSQRALDRLKERFAVGELPEGLRVLAGSESGINDIYMNLNRQLADGKLEEKTKVVVAVAVASLVGARAATDLFSQMALAKGRTRAEVLDAISTAAVCSVFNGYYRWRDQIPADLVATYEAFRAPFNANTFMKNALTPLEMEAVCIAVSSINNCHKCVEGHLNKGKSLGLTDEQIDELLRASSIALATANVISALGDSPVAAAN
jgi:alkyl hydroperoxide reductase subunit D